MKKYIIATHEDGSEITVSDIQKKLLVMMKVIDAFCREHKITYWLCGGSALGAVRHKGFIPWDDDMDIVMLREDYNRFCEVAHLLPEEYHFQSFSTNKDTNVCVPSKVFLKGTKVVEYNTLLKNRCVYGDCLFIDIFIADHISTNKKKDLFYRLISTSLMGMIVFSENIGLRPYCLKKHFVNLAKSYNEQNKESKLIGFSLEWCFNSPKRPVVYPKDSVFPIQYVAFEDTMLPIPNNPTPMLNIEVSFSHMQYPPEKDQRPKHFKDAWL